MLAASLPAFAQTAKANRIAILLPGTESAFLSRLDAFRAEMKRLGYVEGRDLSLEVRWGGDRADRLPGLALELVKLNPDVILTGTSAGVAASKAATSSIPIVFATAGNPVEQGFVASLQRPGGNVTGVVVHSALLPKLIEVAREALPTARRLGILVHETDPAHTIVLEGAESSARRLRFEPILVRVRRAEDLDRAFTELKEGRAELVLAPLLSFFVSNQGRLAAQALQAKLPLFANVDSIAQSGGLVSYGTLSEENYRRAATLVNKILRGAKPAELPVDQPERFVLIVNRATAKAIGVDLAPVTMFRADRIID